MPDGSWKTGRNPDDTFSDMEVSVFIVQQPLFPFKFLYTGYILGYLQRSQICSVTIPYGIIDDIDESRSHPDPEPRFILAAVFKIRQDLVYDMHAFRRMAVLHFPSEDCRERSKIRSFPGVK